MVKKKHNDLTLRDERAYYKPFSYPWAYEAWLKHEQSHWIVKEIPMHEDVKDWKRKLDDKEKNFLTNIFRFFTQGDIDVAGGYVKNYLPVFPQPEVRMMLLGFAGREAVHIDAYSHMIETLGMPESTYNEFLEYAAMREKHDYVTELSKGDDSQVAQQIAVFSAFTEGLQLFSSFIMLMNFPRHGKMKGMGQVISYSLIDETIHCESMIKLFRTYIEENPELWNDQLKSDIYKIAEKMVELEDKFIDLAFEQGPMEDLSIEDMKRYIRYIADRRLIALGLKGIFKVKKNPLIWVEEMINSTQHTNFFENKAVAYAKGALSGTWDDVWEGSAL
jgi:ribonucleoside-diphosphate reductase beta chain